MPGRSYICTSTVLGVTIDSRVYYLWRNEYAGSYVMLPRYYIIADNITKSYHVQENKKRGVISFDEGGSKQINKKNKRYRRICLT